MLRPFIWLHRSRGRSHCHYFICQPIRSLSSDYLWCQLITFIRHRLVGRAQGSQYFQCRSGVEVWESDQQFRIIISLLWWAGPIDGWCHSWNFRELIQGNDGSGTGSGCSDGSLSKLYQLGMKIGDRIFLSSVTLQGSIYISVALIYQSLWSNYEGHCD